MGPVCHHPGMHPVRTISREELQAKLGTDPQLKLIMAGSDWAFRAKHLPRSLHFRGVEPLLESVAPDDEVVVYCSNVDCHASLNTYQSLVERGYKNVRHYPGGLLDWEAAGLPLEGDWASKTSR
jgi:rhodanese-related sulfurtransferase